MIMKRTKQSKKILNIICIVSAFIFTFTQIAVSGIQDDKLHQDSKIEDAQVDNSQNTKVVTVSQDDTMINGSQQLQQDTGLSSMENATSLATGYIQANMSKEEIISTLTSDLGYTQTEAEIAYSKASVTLESQQGISSQTTTTEESIQEEDRDVSAKGRVKQGITRSPRSKFLTRRIRKTAGEGGITFKKKVTNDETSTVKEMLDEGYSIEEIAEGFSQNNYSTTDIIAVFKGAGVSAGDTYKALSKMVISKAEAKVEKEKPKSKFMRRILKRSEKDSEARKKNANKDAVKSLLSQMKRAGYDINGAIDGAVQDLKDAGLSTSEAFWSVYPLIETKKPSSKFRKVWGIASFRKKIKTNKSKYGEAEYAMAAAMMKAGYEKGEISAEFKKSYSAKEVLMIMSAGETRFLKSQNNQTNTNSTNNIDNTNTQQDIIKRQTQSTPI